MTIDQSEQEIQTEIAPRDLTAEAKSILKGENSSAAAAFLQELRAAERLCELSNVLVAKLQNLANLTIPVETAHIQGMHPFPTPYRAPRREAPSEQTVGGPPQYNPWSVDLGFRPNPVWTGGHSSGASRRAYFGMRGVRGK